MATGQTPGIPDELIGMRVYLTFDVEVWCNGWLNLDREFESAFSRYIYGRSVKGDWGLPKTTEILNRYGLTGVFFVETLFSARFGERWLAEIVNMLRSAGQDVQLHLHTEWVDEIHTQVIADQSRKRQHLFHYDFDEQRALVEFGLTQLAQCGVQASAFRAGSYAANADTLRALAANGFFIDTSLNRCFEYSGQGMGYPPSPCQSFSAFGVDEYPVYVFKDGFGRDRPAQLAAAGLSELKQALDRAERAGQQNFVIVSHSFELLKVGSCVPDRVMISRFEGLCSHLAEHKDRYQVGVFEAIERVAPKDVFGQARVSLQPTLGRLWQQGQRRLNV